MIYAAIAYFVLGLTSAIWRLLEYNGEVEPRWKALRCLAPGGTEEWKKLSFKHSECKGMRLQSAVKRGVWLFAWHFFFGAPLMAVYLLIWPLWYALNLGLIAAMIWAVGYVLTTKVLFFSLLGAAAAVVLFAVFYFAAVVPIMNIFKAWRVNPILNGD